MVWTISCFQWARTPSIHDQAAPDCWQGVRLAHGGQVDGESYSHGRPPGASCHHSHSWRLSPANQSESSNGSFFEKHWQDVYVKIILPRERVSCRSSNTQNILIRENKFISDGWRSLACPHYMVLVWLLCSLEMHNSCMLPQPSHLFYLHGDCYWHGIWHHYNCHLLLFILLFVAFPLSWRMKFFHGQIFIWHLLMLQIWSLYK